MDEVIKTIIAIGIGQHIISELLKIDTIEVFENGHEIMEAYLAEEYIDKK